MGRTSVFSINSHLYADYSRILDDVKKTEKLILIDDSKSRNCLSDRFLVDVLSVCTLKKRVIISRSITNESFRPSQDGLDIDFSWVINEITM